MSPDSVLYNAMLEVALKHCENVYGYKYLSDSDEVYIEMFETESQEVGQKDHSSEIGEISITLHGWGDEYSRDEISNILNDIKKATMNLKSGKFTFRQIQKRTFQHVFGDTSQPKKSFTHGVLTLSFNYFK